LKLISEPIVLPQTYSIPQDAIIARDLLLSDSQKVQRITTANEQTEAVNWGREIQSHLADVEFARITLTAPLLAAQRHIMQLAKDHCASLIAEKDRLNRLVTEFQEAERRRVLEAQAKREAEIRKLQEAEEAARRLAEEAISHAQCSDSVENDIEAGMAVDVALEAEAATMTAIVAPLPAPCKATGAATKTELCFEVLDINLLYAARPDLCRPPEAKASAIKAVCTVKDNIPGLRLFEVSKTSFRRT
jgi:hypothetical protein